MPPPNNLRSAPLPAAGVPKSDVKKFIAEQAQLAGAGAQPALSNQPMSVPLTPDLEQFVAKAETTAKLPEPSIPMEAGADTDLTGADRIREAALEASSPAELTQEDKDSFCKSCLFDTPTELNIHMLGGKAIIRVRTLTIMQEDILAWWLQDLQATKALASQNQWLVMFQRAHVLLRVMTMQAQDGKTPEPTIVYSCTELEMVVQECQASSVITPALRKKAIKALQTHVHNTYRSMTPPRYGLLQQAVAVAERKFNALVREAASGNF